MHTQIWAKYLPIIKILLKRSLMNEQVLNLNMTDFMRAGMGRNSGNKFSIGFSKGKAANVVISSQLAKSLSATLLEDAMVKDLFLHNDYLFTMNNKYQLSIKYTSQHKPESELTSEPATV